MENTADEVASKSPVTQENNSSEIDKTNQNDDWSFFDNNVSKK